MDIINCNVRAAAFASGYVSTLAGSPSGGECSVADGLQSAARFFYPKGVTTLSTGDVLVSDWLSCTVRRVTPTGLVTTLLGENGICDRTNGPLVSARVNFAAGITGDAAGNVFIADTGSNAVRLVKGGGAEVLPGFATIDLYAGDPEGFSGSSDGDAASFNAPEAVALGRAGGSLYVMDAGNNLVRRVVCPSLSPSASPTPSLTLGYTWSSSPTPFETPTPTPLFADAFFDAAAPPVNCFNGCALWASLAADGNTAPQSAVDATWQSRAAPAGAARRCAAPGRETDNGALGWCYCKGVGDSSWGYCVAPSATPSASPSRTPSATPLPARACLELYLAVDRNPSWGSANVVGSFDGGASWSSWPMALTADGEWWFLKLAPVELQFALTNDAQAAWDKEWDPFTQTFVNFRARASGGVYRLYRSGIAFDASEAPACPSASPSATASATPTLAGALAPGLPCASNASCAAGACMGSFCCSRNAARLGCATCLANTGACLLLSPGEACASRADCGTNACLGGCCCATSALLVGGCAACACLDNATTAVEDAGACVGGAPLAAAPQAALQCNATTALNATVALSRVIAFPSGLNVTDEVPLLILPAASPANPDSVDIVVATAAACRAFAALPGSAQCSARTFYAGGALYFYLGTASALGMTAAPACGA